MRTRIITKAGLVALALAVTVVAQAETWSTITTGWRPNRITEANDLFWASSTGGLYRIDPVMEEVQFWNKDQGLFSNSLNVAATNPAGGELWVGYQNAGIDRIDPETGEVMQRILDFYQSPDVFEVYDITFDGANAYAATDVGVSKLVPLEGEENLYVVQETYRRFADWPQPITMLSIAVLNDTIFAGGSLGLAVGAREDNLFQADQWTTYDIADEFFAGSNPSSPYINSIRAVNGVLYVCSYQVGAFQATPEGFDLLGNPGPTVYSVLEGVEGRLYGGLFGGLHRYDETGGVWTPVSDFNQKVFDMVSSGGEDEIWVALDTDTEYSGGVGRFRPGEGWLLYPSNTPGGNEVSSMNTAPDGSIWASARGPAGRTVNRLKDGLWTTWSRLNVDFDIFGYTHTSINFDARGNTWIASRGDGAMLIENDSTYTHFIKGTTEYLAGLDPNSNFTLVADFAPSSEGGLWLTNPGGSDGLPLVYVPPQWYDDRDEPWVRFGNFGGVFQNDLAEIELDTTGRLWLAATQTRDDLALLRVNPNGTITDPTDDTYFDYSPSDLGLESAETLIRSMYMGSDQTLWVGTSEGLFYLSPGNDYDAIKVNGAVGSQIYDIMEDPAGRIWCATEFGVSVLGTDRFTWVTNYTPPDGPYPSPLVAQQVNTMTFDRESGEAYLGTLEGISAVTTPYRNFNEEATEVKVAPQPFVIGDGQENRLGFSAESLSPDCEVRIFTPSGHLQRTLSFTEAALDGWDGRTDDGDYVGSGVYYIMVIKDGDAKLGKAAVVRR